MDFSPRLYLAPRGMGGSEERRNAGHAGYDAVVWAHNINEYNDATNQWRAVSLRPIQT